MKSSSEIAEKVSRKIQDLHTKFSGPDLIAASYKAIEEALDAYAKEAVKEAEKDPWPNRMQELKLARREAFEEAANYAACAFRQFYDGENEHAKRCYLVIVEAIRAKATGE